MHSPWLEQNVINRYQYLQDVFYSQTVSAMHSLYIYPYCCVNTIFRQSEPIESNSGEKGWNEE